MVNGPAPHSWELFSPAAAGLDIVTTLRRELEIERACNLQLARELAEEQLKVAELESITGRITPFRVPQSQYMSPEICIGAYSAKVRREKIDKYKRKLRQHRERMQVSRTFPGRSGVARLKPRTKGRFVKQEPPLS